MPPLKDGFGPDVPERIAAMIGAVEPSFRRDAFLRDALDGFAGSELTGRARLVAEALRRHLPGDFPGAADVVEASLGPVLPTEGPWGMAPFLYLPHVYWVAEAGLDHPVRALDLQHALTQRFTAEFGVRPYLERHPELTLSTMERWTADPSAHVRRLVSEGTRPRLPWATRLRRFMRDPSPILPLLEALRDDPHPYVRRSVANNLNDIGRDNPDVLRAVARRWAAGAGADRRRLLDRALRSLVRAGDREAMALVGVDVDAPCRVEDLRVTPATPVIGDDVAISCRVVSDAAEPVVVLAHARVHFAGARRPRPHTFVLGRARLEPHGSAALATRVTLRRLTTRTHRPGAHPVEILVNGRPAAAGAFTLESPA